MISSSSRCRNFGDIRRGFLQVNAVKERKSIYIAQFILCIVSKYSDMDHTVLPANYTMPDFPS